MIDFRLDQFWVESNPHTDTVDVVHEVVANLEIRVGEVIIFAEPDYPVVELAVQLKEWLSKPYPSRNDFVSRSIETVEEGWVQVSRSRDGWAIKGADLSGNALAVRNAEVEESVKIFIEEVRQALTELLDVDTAFLCLG